MTTSTSTKAAWGVVNDHIEGWDTLLRAEPQDPDLAIENEAEEATKKGMTKPPVDLTPITRPNGETYVPRKLPTDIFGDNTDIAFVRMAYEHGMPVLMYGPPGTGKTAMIEAALPNLLTVVGTADTTAADFIGGYVPSGDPDNPYTWVDGPLLVAAENGWPILIDEIALVDTRELAVVYSTMDGRKTIPVSANPARGTVEVQDGFMVFGACNPHVPGAIMSDALLSRFRVHAEVNTDWSLAKKLGVGSKIISVARNLNKRATSGEVVAPPQLREVLSFRDVTRVFGEAVALANFVAQAREEDRPAFAEAVGSMFGDSTVKGLTFG